MYFNKHTHLLSNSIMAVALIRLGTTALEGIFRFILGKSLLLAPDMFENVIWRFQLSGSVFKMIAITVVFYIVRKKLLKYINTVSEDDQSEMGKLQEEFLGNDLSSLSADSIAQLLEIWAVILIGAEGVYTVSTIIYRRFTAELLLMVLGGAQYNAFLSVYNLSHGFKYVEMLTAILIGFFMTGIFLKDNKIRIASIIITIAFLIAFSIAQMNTITLPGRTVGIVWTSVIFHLTETAGLLFFSLYLARNYKGL